METTGDNLIQVKKERSYISCLVNGWSYGFKHLGLLLHYTWFSLLLSVILPIPFVFMFAAQVDAILRKWIELGYLPNATIKTMRRDIEICANRSAIKVLVYMLWMLFIIACIYTPVFLGINFWYIILLPIVFWVMFLPLSVVVMQVSYSDKAISECFKDGMKLGYKKYGKLFAFDFLNLLLFVIIYAIGSIPCLTITLAFIKSYQSVMMGEPWNLPILFPLYYILGSIIFSAVILTTLFVLSFSRCLMWGSLVNEVPAEAEANS